MNTRNIFNKKKSKYKIIIFNLLIFSIIFITIYFIYFKDKKKFVFIPENNNIFYIIPKDRGGEKVPNLNKKSLNSISEIIVEEKDIISNNLLFGIQYYSNSELENVKNYLLKITNLDENIYKLEDFHILALNTDIGVEYFLIYKNFKTRKEALNYCLDFLNKVEKCLVVDTTKF